MPASITFPQFDDETFVVGNGKHIECVYGAFRAMSLDDIHIVVCSQRFDYALLYRRPLGNLLIDYLEYDEIYVVSDIRTVADASLNIENSVMRIEPAKQKLYAESFAADMIRFTGAASALTAATTLSELTVLP